MKQILITIFLISFASSLWAVDPVPDFLTREGLTKTSRELAQKIEKKDYTVVDDMTTFLKRAWENENLMPFLAACRGTKDFIEREKNYIKSQPKELWTWVYAWLISRLSGADIISEIQVSSDKTEQDFLKNMYDYFNTALGRLNADLKISIESHKDSYTSYHDTMLPVGEEIKELSLFLAKNINTTEITKPPLTDFSSVDNLAPFLYEYGSDKEFEKQQKAFLKKAFLTKEYKDEEDTRRWIYVYARFVLALTGKHVMPANIEQPEEEFRQKIDNHFIQAIDEITDENLKGKLKKNWESVPPIEPSRSRKPLYIALPIIAAGLVYGIHHYWKKIRSKNQVESLQP